MKPMGSKDLFKLSGKTAVVIGGAGVLCSSMSVKLAEEGVNVAILDINQAAAESLASGIKNNG
jgi:NAD(P)-dependent dehydrogenase (short-subunit alcohol dehydrogenase family)